MPIGMAIQASMSAVEASNAENFFCLLRSMSESDHRWSQLVSELQGLETPRGSESPPASGDTEGKEERSSNLPRSQEQWALFSTPHRPPPNKTRFCFNPPVLVRTEYIPMAKKQLKRLYWKKKLPGFSLITCPE